MYVIQKCNGTPPGEVTITERNKLDSNHSSIWAESTFLKFNESGDNVAQPKHTDDKVVLGYTYDGLPFQIVVDGMFGSDRNATFEFIDESVAPLMDQYSRDLSDVTKNPDDVTTDFIQTLRGLRPHSAEFTMSIAMIYERSGKLQCSGFGIGDTAIALRRGSGKIEQLVTHNKVNNFKDAFDDFTTSLSINELLTRNTIFTTSVAANDELVGYTWIQEDLQKTQDKYEVTDKRSNKIPVEKIGLEISTIQDGTLYDYLLTENLRIQERRIAKKENGGDDTTLGQIIIPTPELRNTLKNAHMIELEANIKSINSPDLKIKATAVYTELQKLIRKGKNIDSVMQNVALTNQLLTSIPGETRDQLVAQYVRAANQANGKASTWGKALGVAMLVLGAAVAICGVLICIGTLGLGTPVGVAAIVTGVGVSAAGLGIFCKNRQNGLSKAMDMLAAENPGPNSKPN